ncbi:MAG: DUF1926 domain-containing protein [Chromatiales bacterium]|nr:DUF1926 domain-containing protein [Chromatiales bacterium]
MIMVSEAVRASAAPAEARTDLYRAQCNDPYWHGVFGGLYLPHLREAAYHHLLEAEKATPDPPGWRAFDYDADGRAELFYRDATFGLAVKPDPGGTLLEIDHRPSSRNLSNVLSRRREAYHRPAEAGTGEGGGGKSIHELGKALPPGAEELLRYDRAPRRSFVDRFFLPARPMRPSGTGRRRRSATSRRALLLPTSKAASCGSNGGAICGPRPARSPSPCARPWRAPAGPCARPSSSRTCRTAPSNSCTARNGTSWPSPMNSPSSTAPRARRSTEER